LNLSACGSRILKKNDILILYIESDRYPLSIYPAYPYGIVNR